MAHKWALIGNIFVVRWSKMDVKECSSIFENVRNAYRTLEQEKKSGGLFYFTIINEDAPTPTAQERQALEDLGKQVNPFVKKYFLIFEGDSIKHKLQRAMVSGVMMVLGTNIKVFKSTDEAVNALGSEAGIPPAQFMSQLHVRGLDKSPS
jgi:hypothetical protein